LDCPNCGVRVDSNDKFCGACGSDLNAILNNKIERSEKKKYAQKKIPVLATILSLLIIGLGQLYNGDMKKGVMLFIVGVLAGFFSAGIGWLFIGIYSAFDAYRVAKKEVPLWM